VVVENKPGAGGNTAAADVAKTPADGYTMLMGTVGTHAINAALYSNLSFDFIRDIAPVICAARLAVQHAHQIDDRVAAADQAIEPID
jgi:tripartite-type tricarboxylate transporter receptor subunit TctC